MNMESSPSPETKSFSQFHRFSDLPTELRLKVWQFSAHPRLICYRDAGSHYCLTPACGSVVPPLLHVCQESRNEALLDLELIQCLKTDQHQNQHQHHVYINPRTDTLLLWIPSERRSLLAHEIEIPSALTRMHHVALTTTLWRQLLNDSPPREFYHTLRKSIALETISIVFTTAFANRGLALDCVEIGELCENKSYDRAWTTVRKTFQQEFVGNPDWNRPDIVFARLRDVDSG